MKEMTQQISILQNSADWRQRRKAARTLRDHKCEESLTALKDAVKDFDDEVAQAAILALIHRQCKEVTNFVTKPRFILSPNSSLRWTTAHSLHMFGAKTDFGFLLQMSHDADWTVRDEVLSALEVQLDNLQRGSEDSSVDDNDMSLLIRMLQIEHKGIRKKTINILVQKFTDTSLDILLEALNSDSILLKTGLIAVLGKIGGKGEIEKLAKFSSDKSPAVRRAVVQASSSIGSYRVAPVLISSLDDSDSEVVDTARDNLVKLASEDHVVDILIENLATIKSVRIRKNIIHVMGKISDNRVIPSLIGQLGTSYFFIRQAATHALINYKDTIHDEITAAMCPNQIDIGPFLEQCRKETNIYLQRELILLLGSLKNTQAVGLLEKYIESEYTELSTAAENSLDMIFTAKWARANAARLLGEIGGTKAIEMLIGGLQDWSIEIRYEAVLSLRKLRPALATEPIITAISRESDDLIKGEMLATLGDIGDYTPTIIAIVKKHATDQSQIVRQQAIRILGLFDCNTNNIPLLIKSLADQSHAVRMVALNALYSLGPNVLPDTVSTLRQSVEKYQIVHCLNLLGLFEASVHILLIQEVLSNTTSKTVRNRGLLVQHILINNRPEDKAKLFTEITR